MPDAAVAVWRLDPVRANQDRATSASAHWCSSRHRACLDASGLALAETAGVRSTGNVFTLYNVPRAPLDVLYTFGFFGIETHWGCAPSTIRSKTAKVY